MKIVFSAIADFLSPPLPRNLTRLSRRAICYKTRSQERVEMQELIRKLTSVADVDEEKAEKALGIILSLIRSQGYQKKVDALFAKLPGASELAARHKKSAGGGLLSKLGGGPLVAVTKLQAQGLSMTQ